MDNKQLALLLSKMTTCLVLQKNDEYKDVLNKLKALNVARQTVYEAILQSYLHDGYATALEGLSILNEIWEGCSQVNDERKIDQWEKDGTDLFYKIYGAIGDKVRLNISSISPDLSNWMITEGYGKVLSRNHLNTELREILTVVVLTIKSRRTQLFSHIRGALRVGVEKETLHEVFDMMMEYSLKNEIALSRDILNSF